MNKDKTYINAAGFTLLELVVLLSIIFIALIISIPHLLMMRHETDQVRAEGDLRAIQASVESYYAAKREINDSWLNMYPETSDTICETYLLSSAPLMTRTTGPILIDEILYDPFKDDGKSSEYRYCLSKNGQYYVVFSAGADRAYDIDGINNNGIIILTGDEPRDDLYMTNGVRQW